MVRGVTGQVHDLADKLAELELLVVAEVGIEGALKQCGVIKAILRCEEFLDLSDACTNAYWDAATKAALEVLRGCEMICVGVRLAKLAQSGLTHLEQGYVQDASDFEALLRDKCQQSVSRLR